MTIIYLSAAWIAGIWTAHTLGGKAGPWLIAGVLFLFAAWLQYRRLKGWILPAALVMFSMGGARVLFSAALTQPATSPGRISFYNGQKEALVLGTVAFEPQVRDTRLELLIEAESITSRGLETEPVDGVILVKAPRYPEIQYGTRLVLEGAITLPQDSPPYGYRQYLARRGIHSEMAWPTIEIIEVRQGSPLRQVILDLKGRASTVITRQLPDPQSALLTGILLGDDSGLPPDLEEQFRVTGLTHIIAISGFNIAIVTGLLLAISRPLFGPRKSAIFALIGITFYTVLVGADAAVVRAAIMGGLVVIAARLMGRPTFAPAGLFTAALIMTAANPFILWDVGFQLSVAATLGLMLYVGPWTSWAERKLQPAVGHDKARQIARVLAELVFATLAASLLTLPLITIHFSQLSIVSPIANLFVLPAQSGVMGWGGLSTLVGLVFPFLGQLLAWIAWLFLSYTILMVRLFAAFPGAAMPLALPVSAVISLYAVIVALTLFARQSRERRATIVLHLTSNIRAGSLIALLGAVLFLLMIRELNKPDGRLHVLFLDVGQGDATFIQSPSGRQILVDGGAFPTVLTDHLGREMPFWDNDIDIVLATHPDADHVAGLPPLFDHYAVGQLYTNGQGASAAPYQALLSAAAREQTPVYSLSSGQVIIIDDGLRLEILNPEDILLSTGAAEENDLSVVVRLSYGDFSLLLTGDAGEIAERAMVAGSNELASLVYKAGHHGSNTSSSALLLDAVQPQFAVISAGKENRYGHPHQEVLERLQQVGAAVLRTDELGTIELATDGRAMWWQVERQLPGD